MSDRGVDVAAGCEPGFDLTQFDAAFIDRLRHRVKVAGERGIFGVMFSMGGRFTSVPRRSTGA